MKKVIVSVTNDLSTDQRVDKMCCYLKNKGFKVILIGRHLKNNLNLERRYKTKRMRLIFNRSFLFYAEYNIRLFFFLLFKKYDILVSNDLDTLPANYIISKFRKKNLVYDTHEYFTGMPEIQRRPIIKWIWNAIEKSIFPSLQNIITVNDSIADIYTKKYSKNITVVRNIAKAIKIQDRPFDFPNSNVIILQGSGININRGAEEAIKAMLYVKNAVLMIIGGGDVFNNLKKLSNDLNLKQKVIIKNKMPYNEMMAYTQHAHIGLSLDKPNSPNYIHSLPNKLFDYIQAKIPILGSDIKEVRKIITKYNIGKIVETHNPKDIAFELNTMLLHKNKWNKNLEKASQELSWKNEIEKLEKIYSKF